MAESKQQACESPALTCYINNKGDDKMSSPFLSPCLNCYKRSVARKGPIRLKGYYCADLVWDSRGLWDAKDGFEDEGAKKRGKCSNQFIVEEA